MGLMNGTKFVTYVQGPTFRLDARCRKYMTKQAVPLYRCTNLPRFAQTSLLRRTRVRRPLGSSK